MIPGKITETQYKRSVMKNIDCVSAPLLERAGIFADCISMDNVGGDIIISASSATVLRDIGEVKLSVCKAMNKLATKGGFAKLAVVNILLPADFEEKAIKEYTKKYNDILKEYEICLGEINWEYSDNIKKYPQSIINIIGQGSKENFRKLEKKAKPGNAIVMTKSIATELGYLIYLHQTRELGSRFQKSYLNNLAGYGDKLLAVPEAAVAIKHGVTAMHTLGEGGIFAGLWELATITEMGLEVKITDIPVKQDVIEMCEFYNINPYELPSAGSMLIVCEKGEEMVESLLSEGIEAAVIGRMTDSNDKILITPDENIRYVDMPKPVDYSMIFNEGRA